jgi:hypothetical protein
VTKSVISRWSCAAACALGLASAADARGEFCGTLPAAGFDQPPNQAHAGHYLNQVYGYSVVIPAALRAFTQSGGPDRGFGIVLSWSPRAYLSVVAAYDAYFDITPEGVHRRDINAIRLHDAVLSDQASSSSLARVAGRRYVTRVQCIGDPRIYIHDDVIVIRNREIYRLHLQSVPERYPSDLTMLDAMLGSWRWEPLQNDYVK